MRGSPTSQVRTSSKQRDWDSREIPGPLSRATAKAPWTPVLHLVSLATLSPRDYSQLVQANADPLRVGEYELHKVDVISFREPSPPGEAWVAEVPKSCPRQEEGLLLPCLVWIISFIYLHLTGQQAGPHSCLLAWLVKHW